MDLEIHLDPHTHSHIHSHITDSSTLSLQVIENKGYSEGFMLDPREFQYNRIFNGNFENGGRFYAGFQNLKREERATLRIDGEPISELDYKSLHPTMLYHINHIQPPKDIYSILENIPREAYKLAVLVVLNADNRAKATGKLNLELWIEGITLPDGVKSNEVIKTLMNHHEPLDKYFFSGIGTYLQFRDSQIANEIMLHFAKLDKPCLSVHDSFIVKEQDEDLLRQQMEDAYFKHFGFIPKIDKK